MRSVPDVHDDLLGLAFFAQEEREVLEMRRIELLQTRRKVPNNPVTPNSPVDSDSAWLIGPQAVNQAAQAAFVREVTFRVRYKQVSARLG